MICVNRIESIHFVNIPGIYKGEIYINLYKKQYFNLFTYTKFKIQIERKLGGLICRELISSENVS